MKKTLSTYQYMLLIPIYPILHLLDTNIGQVHFAESIRSILLILTISTFFLFLIHKFGIKKHNLGFMYVLSIIIFFSYEPIRVFFQNNNLEFLGRHRFLIPLFGLFFVIIFLILRKFPIKSGQFLKVFSYVLIVLPLLNIFVFEIQSYFGKNIPTNELGIEINLPDSEKPDIYYIILDSYSRDDILDEIYNFDNEPFLTSLEEMGFYIGRCSQSNYPETQFSLTSQLNLKYIQDMDVEIERKGQSIPSLWPFLHNSLVREVFTNAGYNYLAFKTLIPWANIEDADIFFSADDPNESFLIGNGAINEFEKFLLDNSAGKYFQKVVYEIFLKKDINETDNYTVHRNRLLHALTQLEKIPTLNGPNFSHVHLIMPHAPFIFGPNGEDVIPPDEPTKESNILMYKDQVQFINNRLLPILSTIIEESEVPPIIILEGDHGGKDTFGDNRFAILNAIYLPYGNPEAFYSEISLINTFRLIFNEAFGNELDYLPDISYIDIENGVEYGFKQREGCENTTD